MALQVLRIILDLGGDQMVEHEFFQEIKPEQGELREHSPFMRDARGQHIVERRNAVGGDEQQAFVIHAIDVAHLAAGVKLQVGEIGLQENGFAGLGGHGKNFRRGQWRILAPQLFLSTWQIRQCPIVQNFFPEKKLTEAPLPVP